MTTLTALLDHPVAHVVAWTLLHFLWQGALIAGAAAVAMHTARTPLMRYAIGAGGLAIMSIAPIATLAWLLRPGAHIVSVMTLGAAPVLPLVDASATPPALAASEPTSLVPFVIALWLIGVSALSIRLLGGWVVARRLAHRAVRPVSAEIQALVTRMAGRLALERAVRVVESSAIAVPMMVGWLRPVVLLPAAALSGFTPPQIEALIAHELAHVRRHDYLVNLLQSALETLLFYHPAVWWLSRRVRAERELCCDDIALTVCDRIVYATALTDLAALVLTPRLALAATDGSLMARVRRILGRTESTPDTGAGWLPLLVCVALAGTLATAFLGGRLHPRAAGMGSALLQASASMPNPDAAPVPSPQPGPVEQSPAPTAGAQSPDQARETPPDQARERQIEELRKLEREIEDSRREQTTANERERLKIDQLRSEATFKNEVQKTQLELEQLKKTLQLAQRKVEVGTANPDEVEQLLLKIRQAERQMNDLNVARSLEEAKLQLGQRELEQRDVYERRRAAADELRRKIEAVERARADGDVERDRQLERLRGVREVDARARTTLAARAELADVPAENLSMRPDGERIRIGDIMSVEIAGEPDLPRMYTVQSSGTIRLPLIGAIRTEGSTAEQVAKDLRSLLASRQLGDREVVVHTHRRE